MKLNEEMVEAARVVYEDDEGGISDGIRAAIDHYLMNRSLPHRMREAADTLDEASERRGTNGVLDSSIWKATSLRGAADRWEAEDREKGDQLRLAEDFAYALAASDHGGSTRERAKFLLAKFDITRRKQS